MTFIVKSMKINENLEHVKQIGEKSSKSKVELRIQMWNQVKSMVEPRIQLWKPVKSNKNHWFQI